MCWKRRADVFGDSSCLDQERNEFDWRRRFFRDRRGLGAHRFEWNGAAGIFIDRHRVHAGGFCRVGRAGVLWDRCVGDRTRVGSIRCAGVLRRRRSVLACAL
jgi:hypothetical protein